MSLPLNSKDRVRELRKVSDLAIQRAVDKARARDLQALREAAETAGEAFDAACRSHFCDGRWGYYRAVECGQEVPPELHAACDRYAAAIHAFYRARDGERGFLGRYEKQA